METLDVWLKWWSEDADAKQHDSHVYLGVYAGLQVLAIISIFL